jgi:hyperosmotically inducible protein
MRHAILTSLLLVSALPVAAATPDGLITSKTKLALWTTDGIRSQAVHVDTNDGVVTLYGKLPDAAQKALAERTAREVVGVRGVTSLLQVVPGSQEKRVERSDEDTLATAGRVLRSDRALKDSSIQVKSVDHGVVLLAGDASSVSDQLRAVVLVDRIPGVRRVVSEVKGPDALGREERVTFLDQRTSRAVAAARTSASDMRTSAAVKLRLLTAPKVPSGEISVDTQDGAVTLFGIVPSFEVKRAAGLEAGRVSGVLRVHNRLEVVASSQKQRVEARDADITRDLALALKDRVEFKGVQTGVKNGSVQLSGSVASGWDEVNAVRTVRRVTGVRTVEDKLKVEDRSETTSR